MKENDIPSRDQVDEAKKWNTVDIYDSDESWEADFQSVQEMAGKIERYRGRLHESGALIAACLKRIDAMRMYLDRLYMFAHIKNDEDQTSSKYAIKKDRAQSLASSISAKLSFIEPELLRMEENLLRSYMKQEKSLQKYEHFLSEMMRKKPHVLSDKEERLLALSLDTVDNPETIFSVFQTADLQLGKIKNEQGKSVDLTNGRYIMFLESQDRRVRREAFVTMYQAYAKYRHTLAAMLSASIKTDRFYAIARNYKSSLHAALDADFIGVSTYTNLIETVHGGLALLHRYMRIKKERLKLDALHLYDVYAPMEKPPKDTIAFDEAMETVQAGLAPLGNTYGQIVKRAQRERWMDVYENKGKTSGAYSWSVYPIHPYILLNYQGTMNDVFTIAHEIGHAVHSYMTNESQPYIYSNYTIFVAEVASTVNEALLIRYCLDHAKTRQEKAYLLGHFLEEFRGTFFRQVMFAEFEYLAHMAFEKGDPPGEEGFCRIYLDLNKKYFGDDVCMDRAIEMEWARIPHFYRGFYVYKYATGFSAAMAIAKGLIDKEEGVLERYLAFLQSGASDYPLALLQRAGVDLSTPEPIQNTLDFFESLLDEYESLGST